MINNVEATLSTRHNYIYLQLQIPDVSSTLNTMALHFMTADPFITLIYGALEQEYKWKCPYTYLL